MKSWPTGAKTDDRQNPFTGKVRRPLRNRSLPSMSRGPLSLLLAGAAFLILALPALGQDRDSPEPLLPPGFGDPDTLPPPDNKAQPAPRPTPSPSPPVGAMPGVQETPSLDEEDDEELDPLARPQPLNYFSVPEGEARPVDPAGILEPGNFGLAADAFGRSGGPYLVILMQRLDAPLPSRWVSILLRRALMSRVAAPRGVEPVDFVAARADLLLRMGEVDGARLLAQSIDQPFYTPRMIEAAARIALAAADPAGLCPLVGPARSREAMWTLAEAMCAALEGEGARASALVDEARRRGGVGGIDFLLAEKVVGAGPGARRAATLEWEQVRSLNGWRLGLASATGTDIPERLIEGAAPRVQAWFARAPMVPLERRLSAAWAAATLGVFSSQALVEMHGLMLDQTDPAEAGGTIGARLRTAWADEDPGERLETMRALWSEAEGANDRYARLILTAGAAARIAPSADHAPDADELIASMLSAGMDRRAARWSGVVEESGNDRAWALLALGAPRVAVDLSSGRIESFIEADDSDGRRRSQILVAALGGLARIDEASASGLARAAGLSIGEGDLWTAAIDRAAANREPGTVALLAGIGMQTGDWRGVPPAYLFRIVRALRIVGLEFEARMIAAEAVARL